MNHMPSKAEDARLGRWSGVGYAMQVVGRACTEGALTKLYRCQKCGLMPKDHVMWCLMREWRMCDITQIPHQVLLCVLRCPSEHEIGTCMLRHAVR